MTGGHRVRATVPLLQRGMLVAVAGFAGLSLIGSPYPDLAPMQNLPTLLIVAGLYGALRRWPMSNGAMLCLVVFLALHTLGGRYAYSYVPYDRWLAQIGLPTFADVLGATRNGFDRLVHFSFGALMVHPIRQTLIRHGRLSGRLALYVAIEFVLAGSALYEIFEWLLTLAMVGAAADAYNGQQGDVWDAQKDMTCAAVGAVATGMILAVRGRRR